MKCSHHPMYALKSTKMIIELFFVLFVCQKPPTYIGDCFWSIDFCNGDFYLNVSNNSSLNLYTGNQIHL